jgi:ketosteroid isomerase-like protein
VFQSWYEAWDDLIDVCDEIVDAGDYVVSVSTMRARGRISGAEVTSRRYSGVWTIDDGRVTRVVWFATREEALEAAGLRD